ncbi:MAG: biotin/lipoyl-binding protein [Gemmataceae bacterium]|nr:biotin/lipoyl-binding protein [Gemmataceae bacterium]
MEVKLPALKENVEIVEVNAVKVCVGDLIAKDQSLLEVQADKAALEVPSPIPGKVAQILVKTGDQVKIGQVIFVLESVGATAVIAPGQPSAPAPSGAKEPAPAPVAPVAPSPSPANTVKEETKAKGKIIPAGPSTRRLARELLVDLAQVPGSGRHGRVVEEDVRTFTKGPGAAGPTAVPPLPRFEDFGPIERQNMSGIRRATAKQMNLSWSVVPHVTQHDLADITDFEHFRKSETKGPKLTITAVALKAVAILLKEYPVFNSSVDMANHQIVYKKFINIGVAVDTEIGLLVPVLRDVNQKSIVEIATELTALAEKARQKKLDGKDLSGGTFTVTNLGSIGGTGFTPIVNYPEVAILGLSRGRLQPVVHHGEIVPRLILPLSLSYDHRVIDGAAAARFTRRLADMLENPYQLLLHA